MPKIPLETGVSLHYLRDGDRGRDTVVLINGLTMDTGAWEAVSERLAARFEVLRYDCRGQGQSDKPPGPYPPEQHADDLCALLTTLKLGRVHLAGLSNGGLIAALTAGKLSGSGRIASLTMIDSFARSDALFRALLRSWKAALEQGGSALRFDVAVPWVWGPDFLDRHLQEVMALRAKAAAADPAVIGALIDGLLGWSDAAASLQSYRGPLLVMVGEDDVLSPIRYSREIIELAGRGRLEVIARSGHASPIERPREVADLLGDFLEQYPPEVSA